MKQFLTFTLLLFSILLTGQCHTNICNAVYLLPIVDIGDFNADTASYKCITNLETGGQTINSDVDFGEYNHLSFTSNVPGGYINIEAPLSIWEDQTVYFEGDASVYSLSLDSRSGPTNIYIEQNSYIEIVELTSAQGYDNYIHVGEGSTLSIDFITYEPGDTIVIFDKPYTCIYVVDCQPIILAPAFERFFINDLIIYWIVNGNSVTIQKKEGDNWMDIYMEVGESKGTFVPKEEGYYRGMSEYGPSNVVYFKPNFENIIYNLKGQRILNPESNIPYIRNGKKFMIIE